MNFTHSGKEAQSSGFQCQQVRWYYGLRHKCVKNFPRFYNVFADS